MSMVARLYVSMSDCEGVCVCVYNCVDVSMCKCLFMFVCSFMSVIVNVCDCVRQCMFKCFLSVFECPCEYVSVGV